MSENSLSIEDLDIVRAPGFESGGFQATDLSGGINVVYGPNASGKTTMARSLQDLLWPGEARAGSSLVGRLSLNGDEWRVRTDESGVAYQRNGQEANGPGLPPADQRDRYHLCLHDLLRAETRNESFAATIERESAGGFDLAAAADSLEFDDSPSTRGIREVSDADSAVEDWREAQAAMETLRDEQRQLTRLRADRERANEARDRAELLEQALDHAEARNDLDTATAAVAALPDTLASVDGDEAETVAELEGEISEWRGKEADAEATRADARDVLGEVALPDEGVADGVVERLKSLANRLGSLERTRRDNAADLDAARAQRASCVEDVSVDVSEEALAGLDSDALGEISAFVRDAERVREDRQRYEATQRWLEDQQHPDADLQTLRQGRQALENWLKTQHREPVTTGASPLLIGAISALLLGVAGVALGYLVHPALYLFVASGLPIVAYGYYARPSVPEASDADTVHRTSFEDLGLEPLESWEPEEVRRRLTDIYGAIAAHEFGALVDERRDALESGSEQLERQEDDIQRRRRDLRAQFGIDLDVSDVELLAFAKCVLRWQEHNDRVVGLESEIGTIDGQLEAAREDLDAALEPYGYETIEDAARADEHIANLESRVSRHREARRDLSRATATVEEATAKIGQLETERDAVFEDAGLDPGETERLRMLCDRADEYRTAVQEVNRAEAIVEREARALETYPGFEPDLLTQAVPELEREKRRVEETADTYDEIQRTITEIETKVNEAKDGSAVEAAAAEKRRALDALEGKLAEDCASLVGSVLTDHVREATGETSRPAVFQHAREVLARITHGRYRLDLDESGDGTFRAYDTVTEQGYDLDDLSSATRLQVLLAVRVAFVEQREQGTQLPLILDETLANTDDGKAGVIIDSMIELANGGRQVFYFTAQGDEVGKWRRALEETATVDYREIDLSTVRGLDDDIHVPDLESLSVHAASPPTPDGHDHESYGEALGVEPFNPRLGAGNAHLWYVVDDVALLSQLLEQGIERWGQLRTLLTWVGPAVIVDEPAHLDGVEANGVALEAFVRSWEIGRGERVDREVLEDSGAVSGTYIDRVTDLAEGLNGEAERIVEALRDGRVDRFRTGKIDDLETYFAENGYIESVEPIAPEAIRLTMASTYVENGLTRAQATQQADALLERIASTARAVTDPVETSHQSA
ncbi:SMC family ATPase [Natronobiforma cellulositropha]|uniref:SMC family ATPase n=1 Tax=Natronobiforma cellulositropha TaxID=1679076 RepID=UPI0021D5FAD8|nr:SMC family ATPase [Natronobiforma cellulositropha]